MEKAETVFREAIRLNPEFNEEHACAQYNLFVLLMRQGRREEAERAFFVASLINPDLPRS
jgi:tetratricopeptide (TPR) repeat protein